MTRVTLSEATEINAPPRRRPTPDEDVSFLPMSDVDVDGRTGPGTSRPFCEVSNGYTLFERGDVLVAKITPCFENGKIAQAATTSDVAAGSTEFHVVRPVPGVADSRYILHFLRHPHVRSAGERRMTGSGGQRRVPEAFLRDLQLPLPPIEEQRRIAAVLDEADELRAKRQASLAMLDSLIESIFIDMFGDPGSAGRSPRTPLAAVCDIQIGYPFKSELYTLDESGVRLCRGANVLPGKLDWHDLQRYPAELANGFETYRLAANDVVVAMDRPWIKHGFKVALVTDSDADALLVQRVARLRASEPVNGPFLYVLMRRPSFTRHCRPTETTIPHISPKEIREYSFAVPVPGMLRQFDDAVAGTAPVLSVAQIAAAKSELLFASLQHRAFAGQL